jgi:hypothetical protein
VVVERQKEPEAAAERQQAEAQLARKLPENPGRLEQIRLGVERLGERQERPREQGRERLERR